MWFSRVLLLLALVGLPVQGSISQVGAPLSAGCTNNSFTCAITYTPTNAGDAIYAWILTCYDSGCTSSSPATLSLSDTKNTYVTRACAHTTTTNPSWDVRGYVVGSLASGAATLTVTSAQTFFYGTIYLIEYSGVNSVTPTDSNSCKGQAGTTTPFTMTAPGNPTSAGEVIVGTVTPNSGGSVTFTGGTFSYLSGSTTLAAYTGPPTNTPVAMTGTLSGTRYWLTMDGLIPLAGARTRTLTGVGQ